MRIIKILFASLLLASKTFAQIPQDSETILARLSIGNSVPKDLLATRSVIFHDQSFTQQELEKIQEAFQQTGIDAIGYFVTDVAFAGKDITRANANYFISREIGYIIFFSKTEKEKTAVITAFNGKQSYVNPNQPAWKIVNQDLIELLATIYRTAINDQEQKNFLINDNPESGFKINYITGRRSAFFAIDLKVDRLAVPWFENAARDSTLSKFFKENYPLNYGMVKPIDDEKEYRKMGFHFVLCYVHTRGEAARNLLGYTDSNESAITSVTYPNGELKLKTIPASTSVYKFYVKHIDSGNVFLGTKWDADTSWDDALRNYIKAFKAELKLN